MLLDTRGFIKDSEFEAVLVSKFERFEWVGGVIFSSLSLSLFVL
jgi:hypothetical protein